MSYNLLSGSVKFTGNQQGTIEDVVDTHSDQTVSGQKTITNLSSSTAHVTTRLQVGGVHATDHAVNVNGAISGSGNISGSAFYANGVLISPVPGAVSAVANGVNNRIATFSSSDALNGEENLTFNGTVLDFKATSISGSGNISGSAFYGNWAGATILGSQVQLASSKGIQDDSGLALNVAGLAVATPAGGNTVVIDQGAGAKKCTVTNLMALAPVSDASALGNGGRVLLDGGVGTITTNANLSFGGTPTTLSVTGEISASSNVNVGGILRVDNHISASYMTLANRISHEGDEDTYISLSNNSISFTLANGQHLNMNGNTDQTTVSNSDFRINGTRPDFRVFNATGHVGVGTVTPTVPLEVSSSTAAQLKLTNTVAKAAEFTVAANGDLTIKPSGSAIFDSNLTINGNSTLGDASGDVTTINGTAVTIPNGLNFDSNTLVIDHTNNRIGIGAPTPSTTLEVAGDVKISGVTPFITIGDGDAEDCGILLNCTGSGVSGIDYYVAIDYSYNSNNGALIIGAGDVVGSNSAIQIHNGRIGLTHTGTTPSSLSVDAGKHLVVGAMGNTSPLPAHNANETVIAQATDSAGQALKIPENSVITKVVLVVTGPSNLGTHNAAVFLASDTNAAADASLSNKIELLGAGAAGTKSTDNNGSATDIDLKQGKEVWINTDLNWVGGDRYVYLVNTGTGNGTTTSDAASVVVYVEYYGID